MYRKGFSLFNAMHVFRVGILLWLDKDAMTPKSFANFVRLTENFLFKNKLV